MTLPEGRTGRLLALGLTLALLGVVWLVLAAPLLGWYAAGAARLAEQRRLATHMATLTASLPALRRRVADAVHGDAAAGQAARAILLPGDSDAVAGAHLQEQMQALAARLGLTPSSIEMLPVTQAGGYRRIALRLSVAADWSVLVRLVQMIAQATPRVLIDDLNLHAAPVAGAPRALPMTATLSVVGFRAGAT
jgi:general secretion pathway protein M